MVQSIRQYLFQLVINNSHLFSGNLLNSIKKMEKNICIFDLLSKENTIDNDSIVDLLVKKYNFPFIDANTENIKACSFEKINDYFKEGYFTFKDVDGVEIYAINNLSVLRKQKLNIDDTAKVYLIKQKDLIQIIERGLSEQNTRWAVNYLDSILPLFSAKNINYSKMTTGFFIVFFSTLTFFFNLFSIANNLAYLLQNILKAILFKRGVVADEESPLNDITNDIPIYSILIPLYKEELKVYSIIKAMDKMNYPQNKLDVKLIIEEDDILTLRAIKVLNIPPYVQIIKVPYSFPRTKPKALNYAMSYVKGKFITIYDAEDIPDPDQLLKALYAFNTLPQEYVCVQAKLNFYNAKKNFLTRFFSLEYSVWFNYLLKGLSLLNLPVTLGGTSNHFKVDKLKEVGYWDPYNVTEDAELGIRLYMQGYKVHMINSVTMEESPTDVWTWIAQRARWIKGFIQTSYVFLKIKKDYSKFNMLKIFTVYVFVGLSTYSFFCLPWLIFMLMFDLNHYIYNLWMINSIFSFSYMYAIAYFVLLSNKTTIKNLSLYDWITLLLWPFYFILHTVACYRAIWEVLVSPFNWNKTPHGESIDEINSF